MRIRPYHGARYAEELFKDTLQLYKKNPQWMVDFHGFTMRSASIVEDNSLEWLHTCIFLPVDECFSIWTHVLVRNTLTKWQVQFMQNLLKKCEEQKTLKDFRARIQKEFLMAGQGVDETDKVLFSLLEEAKKEDFPKYYAFQCGWTIDIAGFPPDVNEEDLRDVIDTHNTEGEKLTLSCVHYLKNEEEIIWKVRDKAARDALYEEFCMQGFGAYSSNSHQCM